MRSTGRCAAHLREHNERSRETGLLYASYRKHLGPARMPALLRLQASLVPVEVRRLLGLKPSGWVTRLLMAYRYMPTTFLLRLLNPVLLPKRYAKQLAALGNIPFSGRVEISNHKNHLR